MSRYTKIASKYILSKFHQDTSQGAIYERDWTTIGNVHRLEPGKRVYYGSSNFIFTENTFPVYKKKRKTGKWVGSYTYEDVETAEDVINLIKVNTDSENLSDYAYWGSMTELFRGSVEHIISTFPGRLRSTTKKLSIHHHWDNENGGVEYWTDAPGYILGNPFSIDMHTEVADIDKDDILKYLSASWKNYNLEDYSNETTATRSLTTYEIDKSTYEQYDCEGRYFRLCSIIIFAGTTTLIVDTYLTDGKIVYCYRSNDDPSTYEFLITYFSGLLDNQDSEYNGTSESISHTLTEEDLNIPTDFAICPEPKIIEDYFRGLEGFEWKLLNRKSKPFYKNTFLFPVQLDNGNWRLVRRTYAWPSEGLWIDVESLEFDGFINNMVALCEVYDNLWCDSIWRCMVHESVKNFDWSYRREYDDNDAIDNIDGGNRMKDVMRLYGIFYDTAKRYVDGIGFYNNVTYDGYNNCPEAQISDRNLLQGWDVTSTQHQFYWYFNPGKVTDYTGYVSMPVVPFNVDDESPDLVAVTCAGAIGTTAYTKQTLTPSEISLDESFFHPEGNVSSIVWKRANPWVNDNVYGKLYVEVPYTSIPNGYLFTDANTFNDYPYQLFDGTVYPDYVQVLDGNSKRYYQLLSDTNAFDTNNRKYVNDVWFDCVNENAVTPATTDILFNRELNLSSNRILKTKGTKEAIDMVFSLFGFGRYDSTDNPYGDYTIEERYDKYTPKEYGEKFYFYEIISEEEAEGQTVVTVDELPVNPTENSAQYLKIVTQIDDDSRFETYYRLNGENTVEETIRLLFAHRTTERIYDDIYSGVPINDYYVGQHHMIIPFIDRNRTYEGNIYFEAKGAWLSTGDETWENSETIPYMHILQRISDLFAVNTTGSNDGDIYFVADVSDYYTYTNDVPYYLSNFFKLKDKYNSSQFSGWVNIPIEGPIQNGGFSGIEGVTKEDYQHAKHMDSIITSVLFNNPHCGYDRYDRGAEYKSYMEHPYKYSADNYLYDDDYYQNMARQFTFAHTTETFTDDEKTIITATTVSYENNGRAAQPSAGEGDVSIEYMPSNYVTVNDKYLKITLFDNGYPINASDPAYRMHLEYMRNVVMKYVVQVIPSTTILVLDNFETPEPTSIETVEITVTVEGEGTVYGTGTYLKSTMVTLNAVASEGYHFVGWRGVNRSSAQPTPPAQPEPFGSFENTLTVMACSDKNYTAVFAEDCEMGVGCLELDCGGTPSVD